MNVSLPSVSILPAESSTSRTQSATEVYLSNFLDAASTRRHEPPGSEGRLMGTFMSLSLKTDSETSLRSGVEEDVLLEGTMEDRGTEGLSRREIFLAAGVATAGIGGLPATAQQVVEKKPAEQVEVLLNINGQSHQLALDVRTSLLDLLREHLHLTGTKKGCNQGACGACTVLVDGRRINSCLTLAVMHQDSEITTIEGVTPGDGLHPLQAAFADHDAFQCGYCTPGQILSGIACIQEGHTHSEDEIRNWMSGNICRCGAYPGVVAAIAEVSKRAEL